MDRTAEELYQERDKRVTEAIEFLGERDYATVLLDLSLGSPAIDLTLQLGGGKSAIFPVDAPENLLWVHMGDVDSYLDVALRAVIPLTPAHTVPLVIVTVVPEIEQPPLTL